MSAHVFHQLYYHFVWSTKDRMPCIQEARKAWLIAAIESDVRSRKGSYLACNTMPDHVHLLVNLPPTLAPATFIGQVKGAVSHDYHAHFGMHDYMKWQEGYGVVSMRKNDIVKAIAYITNQEAIHAARKTSALMEKIDTDGW